MLDAHAPDRGHPRDLHDLVRSRQVIGLRPKHIVRVEHDLGERPVLGVVQRRIHQLLLAGVHHVPDGQRHEAPGVVDEEIRIARGGVAPGDHLRSQGGLRGVVHVEQTARGEEFGEGVVVGEGAGEGVREGEGEDVARRGGVQTPHGVGAVGETFHGEK